MKINVTVDIKQALATLRNVRNDQIPFATSRALNDVAAKIQADAPRVLRAGLDRPTPFTTNPRGLYVQRATKRQLEAEVGFKPAQAKYLKYQIEGGEREPAKKALRLPTEQPLDQYGNLPPRTIATLIARAQAGRRLTKKQSARLKVSQKVDIFYGDPADGRPPGLYQRVPVPGAGDNRLIPLVMFPAQSARYEVRVPWYAEAKALAEREIRDAVVRAVREAMATAR